MGAFEAPARSIPEQTSFFRLQIEALPGLSSGVVNSLLSRIDLKQNSADPGKVRSLISELQAMIKNGKLTLDDVDPLLTTANQLLVLLG
jgi:hypothetical protein